MVLGQVNSRGNRTSRGGFQVPLYPSPCSIEEIKENLDALSLVHDISPGPLTRRQVENGPPPDRTLIRFGSSLGVKDTGNEHVWAAIENLQAQFKKSDGELRAELQETRARLQLAESRLQVTETRLQVTESRLQATEEELERANLRLYQPLMTNRDAVAMAVLKQCWGDLDYWVRKVVEIEKKKKKTSAEKAAFSNMMNPILKPRIQSEKVERKKTKAERVSPYKRLLRTMDSSQSPIYERLLERAEVKFLGDSVELSPMDVRRAMRVYLRLDGLKERRDSGAHFFDIVKDVELRREVIEDLRKGMARGWLPSCSSASALVGNSTDSLYRLLELQLSRVEEEESED